MKIFLILTLVSFSVSIYSQSSLPKIYCIYDYESSEEEYLGQYELTPSADGTYYNMEMCQNGHLQYAGRVKATYMSGQLSTIVFGQGYTFSYYGHDNSGYFTGHLRKDGSYVGIETWCSLEEDEPMETCVK